MSLVIYGNSSANLINERVINAVQIGFVENHRTTDYIFTLKSIILDIIYNIIYKHVLTTW